MSLVAVLLGVSWGVLAALPLARAARRCAAGSRARELAGSGTGRPSRRVPRWARERRGVVIRVAAGLRERQLRQVERDELLREMPVVVDLLGVAVGAGSTPFDALGAAVRFGPPRSAEVLRGVLRAQRLGVTLDEALREVGARHGAWRGLTDALRDAGRLGVPLRPALARLAAERRADLRRAAETRARTVPVRLLFPLVFLVLPAFGLLTVAPAVLAGLAGG